MSNRNKEITIAVLPFQVLTDIEKLNPIMLGFTEDLITNFSKFNGLSVLSHFSTRQFKNTSNINSLTELNVDYVVTGSFRSHFDKIRINIRLINASENSIVFAGQHLETPESIFLAEDAVTHQIVNVLQQQIDYNLLSYSYKKKNTDLDAYVYWLKGMDIMYKGTLESDLKARKYFNEALKVDPNYARAYTGISLSYFNEWSCQVWDRWEVSSKGAHKYALKALELDENDYQALMVLGRTYLYSEEYEKAEHCLRKSLRMNPNDALNLMSIAFLLVYLGHPDEALKLYNKANTLNPFHKDKFLTYGTFIYFELSQFEKALELAKKIKLDQSWVDFPVFIAAIYFHINDLKNVRKYWNIFVENFSAHIKKNATEREALEWQINVNPFKGKTNLRPFWDFIAKGENISPASEPIIESIKHEASFIKKGDMWEVIFQGQNALVKDSKGNSDIAILLSTPNSDIHCMELMGSNLHENIDSDVIDEKAKASYQKKIESLLSKIEDAKEMQNYELTYSLEKEYESLVDHLSKSLGLAGKPRKIGSSVEKARSAVTWRIRSAIKKIDAVHPQLAKHLSNSISTGTFCSYKPELKVTWMV
ncbi:tetratricopeptide repeat protein [Flavobacteriaceae bacterium MJ-SS4]|uniref:tetratricopeptide repeat protein n=1 Tax=Gilvirhabdus luticola TaxID=3079858 RepID=UPI0032DCBB0A